MPRKADGTWVDSAGNTIYSTNPKDNRYYGKPGYVYTGGRWTYNGQPIPERADLPRNPATGAGDMWPDGTPVTAQQKQDINSQANGQAPRPGAPNYGVTGFADPSGATNNYLKPDAPGATVNTAQPDADRQKMADYLAQLQDQAATGNGAWQQSLASATQQGSAAASALGQSAQGVDPMAQARNVANGQAGVEQRAAGQAVTLRAQQQQQAQQQLADVYAAQGATDASQSAQQAAAIQGRREANQAINEQANKTNSGMYSGFAQGVVSLLSDGGPVPGQPEVFGDDEANDTVPAMLSPGEIVLPRSVTHSANPESAAAAFVRAVQEHHGGHFAPGGQVPPSSGPQAMPKLQPDAQLPESQVLDASYDGLPQLANDSSVTGNGDAGGYLGILGVGGGQQQKAGVRNGGLLDTTAYNANRTSALGADEAFLRAYQGRGPSGAGQAMTNATDANIADAMATQAGLRGAGRGAAVGNIASQASQGESQAAGKAADTTAGETTRAGASYAKALQQQRNADLAYAVAQQQAAWRNSMLNSGIGLAQQAQIRGILGGAGQAFVTGANALSGKDWGSGDGFDANAGDSTDYTYNEDFGDNIGDSPTGGGFDTSSFGDSGVAYAAHGGQIRGYADGGELPTAPNPAAEDALIDQMMGKPPPKTLWDPSLTSMTAVPPPVEPGPSGSPPGIVAQMTPAAVVPAPRPAPVVQSAPRAATKAPSAPDNYALEQQSVAQEASANEEAGRARAEAALGAQKVIEESGRLQREQHARARMAADADMARVLEARQAMQAIDTKVDTGRWWASRSTPGKIAAAIGLALGAIGAGNDGVNRAAGIIENSIGRDLEAQKAEHEFKLRKGQAAVDSATSIYTLHRQLAQDDIASTDAAKATALELAKAQVDVATAKASSPIAKAQGQMLSAQLAQKRDEHDAAVKQRGFDNYVKAEDMRTRRIAALKDTGNQAEKGFAAPGYKLMPGAAPKVEELAKWRDGLAEKKNTDQAIAQLKQLVSKSSLLPGSQDAARAQSLIADLKVGYKNMATLGALSGSDYALIDSAIPDPTSLRGHLTSDKTIKSRLDQFAQTADNKFHNRAQVLGIVKDEGSSGGDVAAAKAWLEANPTSPKAAAVRAKLQQMGAL